MLAYTVTLMLDFFSASLFFFLEFYVPYLINSVYSSLIVKQRTSTISLMLQFVLSPIDVSRFTKVTFRTHFRPITYSEKPLSNKLSLMKEIGLDPIHSLETYVLRRKKGPIWN